MSLTVFDFNGLEIHTFGTWDEPLFIAKDVCEILDISKYHDALARLEDYRETGSKAPS